jgi:hypothetical protein
LVEASRHWTALRACFDICLNSGERRKAAAQPVPVGIDSLAHAARREVITVRWSRESSGRRIYDLLDPHTSSLLAPESEEAPDQRGQRGPLRWHATPPCELVGIESPPKHLPIGGPIKPHREVGDDRQAKRRKLCQ